MAKRSTGRRRKTQRARKKRVNNEEDVELALDDLQESDSSFWETDEFLSTLYEELYYDKDAEIALSEDLSDDDVLLPHNHKHLGSLFAAIFGLKTPEESFTFPLEYQHVVSEAVEAELSRLTLQEQKIVRMRFGLTATQREYNRQYLADRFGQSTNRIQDIEKEALRKLRRPSSLHRLKAFLDAEEAQLQGFLAQRSSPQRLVELTLVVQAIKRLEPSLIAHLKQHNDDLIRIDPVVFEHLFAEFLAARGFDDVRLVGRNSRTSADIFATKFMPGPEIPIKLFVEVKRWKDTIGVEVINQVLGAFLGERERFGWNAALVVTVGGFRDFEKWSREELALKGLYLKDRADLLRYLDGYKQHTNGLWLPNPRTDL